VPLAEYPESIPGEGLELRPWDEDLAEQMGNWRVRGFPYHAFDLPHLQEPAKRAAAVAACREDGPQRHFVAVEGGVAVGRVSVNVRDLAGTYLWAVHVAPEHEGRGVCRRMLAALMTHLEQDPQRTSFVLTTNSFAEHAHRAYRALGFEITETRWHFDREVADALWRVTPKQREPVSRHIRFQNGRWQVRSFIMRRGAGTPMNLASGSRTLAASLGS
jgi:RimJ/RimL family protein N-acetyltransferase